MPRRLEAAERHGLARLEPCDGAAGLGAAGRHGSTHPEGIVFCDVLEDVFGGADALVILTEWNVYRGLNLKKVKKLMKGNVLVDLRNIYERETVEQAGYSYFCVGR